MGFNFPSVRLFVRPSVHNLCQGAYSVAVIAGSMKPCIVIMPPTLKKLMGHIAFGACVGGCVRGWVRACVGHTFCTYCNF